jgi:hypothetical protein
MGVYLDVDKDIDFGPRLRIGVEYTLANVLALRVGGVSNPGTFHAGIGLEISKRFNIDLGTGYHTALGFTPAIGLTFSSRE